MENNLGEEYSYTSRIINFKNYGACSSRQRTVVIGVSKDYADEVSPFELYPDLIKERTLREVIGDLKSLKEFGEIDDKDIYHAFRTYPEHMRAWISDIIEGQSAFDNTDDSKKPHQIIDGKIVINKQKTAISTKDSIGIKSVLVFIQEMTKWQVKILFIRGMTEFSALEN
ncbi:MAG: DNA cytosine methyltransferase [Dysgonamonadaceae bacterium]|nr:DNA cytosine methyltransferase [Dysgonamonadaceae bacterium]